MKIKQYCKIEESHEISVIWEEDEIETMEDINKNLTSFAKETEDKFKNNPNINQRETANLITLINEFQEIFTWTPGLIEKFEYSPNIKDTESYYVEPYPIPMKEQLKVRSKLNKLERQLEDIQNLLEENTLPKIDCVQFAPRKIRKN